MNTRFAVCGRNVAVIVRLAAMLSGQSWYALRQPALADQPAKYESEPFVVRACSVRFWLSVYSSVQSAPHEMPAMLDVTVPAPAPASTTVKRNTPVALSVTVVVPPALADT